MTYREFIQHLSNAPDKWVLDDDYQIRTKDLSTCPICAVANAVLETDTYELDYKSASQAIGLDFNLAGEIAGIADEDVTQHGCYFISEEDKRRSFGTRRDLLAACNINPEDY